MLDGNLWLRISRGPACGADLQLIQELYVIERRATADGCDVTERLRRRQESSVPRMSSAGAGQPRKSGAAEDSWEWRLRTRCGSGIRSPCS